MSLWRILVVGAGFGLTLGLLASGIWALATGTHTELSWVEPTFRVFGLFASLAFSVLSFVLMYSVFRWWSGSMGLTRRPIVTRQIGGVDVRPSRRGSELPPLRFLMRRFWCRRHVPARVRSTEGAQKFCVNCGKDLEEGRPEQWI